MALTKTPRPVRVADLSIPKLKRLILDLASAQERYFSSWPAEMVPPMHKNLHRAVRVLRKKEKANARSR